MAWGEEKSDDSSWAFSTEPSSSEMHDNTTSGVEPFSTEPAQNWGQRSLSNWGQEPRLDDPVRSPSIWRYIARLFGGA